MTIFDYYNIVILWVLTVPTTRILIYCNERKESPLLTWLEGLRKRNPKARAKCLTLMLHLEREGHELRRPHADYLRDGIRELRMHLGRVQYRILYSFHGRDVAILTHGLVKERQVPDDEIEFAIKCMEQARTNLDKFTLEFRG